MTPPPEELDTQVPEKQGGVGFQLFTSLLPAMRGWFASHSLQPTAPPMNNFGQPILIVRCI
jgi:hypothetical protein